jgi:outer membrane protein insertion porin family
MSLIDDQVFERLKNKTSEAELKKQQDDLLRQAYASQHKEQERLGELVGHQLRTRESLH